jgi:hypothetical protein
MYAGVFEVFCRGLSDKLEEEEAAKKNEVSDLAMVVYPTDNDAEEQKNAPKGPQDAVPV